MLKKTIRFVILAVSMLALSGWMSGPTAAQSPQPATGDDLSTTLARAAAKGYLTGLKYPSTPSIAEFYLTDEAAGSDVAGQLSGQAVQTFAIVDEAWTDDDTFRVTAQLDGQARLLTLDVQKVGYRWQVTGLAWADRLPTEAASAAPLVSALGTVQVGSIPVNVRSGPGLIYAVQSVLPENTTIDVTGTNALGTWYQVARNGQIIGWITASPKYVSLNSTAQLPTVAAPAVSSGGGKLVLQGQSGGQFYLLNADLTPFADGAVLRPIAGGIDPALSPDGAQIAFTRWGRGGNDGSVWVMDLASGQERQVAGEIKQPKSPTWSPDGRSLAISYQNGGRLQIEYACRDIRSDGTFPKPPQGAYDFQVKGLKLCYKLPVDTHWSLRTIDLDTGAVHDMASDRYSYAPTWDPANPWRVVFAASSGLQQLDVNRNVYFAFGPADFNDRAPVFSPDGSRVAVSYRQHNHWEVYTIDAASGDRARLTQPPLLGEQYNSAAPAFSPNGQKIAFITDRRGPWEFWTMNVDGTDPRPLLSATLAGQIPIEYNGQDERLISWGP